MTEENAKKFEESPAFEDWKYLLSMWKGGLERSGIKKLESGIQTDLLLGKISNILKYGMKDRFELIGEGSSRAVFSFVKDPDYVLKLAFNSKGLGQNRTEFENVEKLKDYACFARIREFDGDDAVFMVADYCQTSQPRDWIRIIGLPIETVLMIFHYVISRNLPLKYVKEQCGKDWNDVDPDFMANFRPNEFADIRKFCENVMESDERKWTAFRDIIRFHLDNGTKRMLLGDLGGYANWGVLKGETPDEDAIVIIDAGFGDE